MHRYKVILKQKNIERPNAILGCRRIHISGSGHFVKTSKQQLRICLSFLFLLPFLFIIQMNLPLAFISLQHIQRDNTSPVIFIVMPHYILFFFLFIFNVWWYMMVLAVSELLRVHFHQSHKLLMGYDENNFYMAQEEKVISFVLENNRRYCYFCVFAYFKSSTKKSCCLFVHFFFQIQKVQFHGTFLFWNAFIILICQIMYYDVKSYPAVPGVLSYIRTINIRYLQSVLE